MTVQSGSDAAVKKDTESPWLVFVVNEVFYALNTTKVQSIMKMPQLDHFVSMPDAPEYVRSLVKIRDNVVPALDLRKLYGLASVEDEYMAFKAMIDARKQDHQDWMTALEQSVLLEEPFKLATDPRKCKFGQWFYAHKADHQSIQFVMDKIEKPHQKLHEAALRIMECKEKNSLSDRSLCVDTELKRAREENVPKVLALLEKVKEVFHHRYQEKLIVLEDGERRVALIVDDVKAIDDLTAVEGHDEFNELVQNRYIYSVGRGKKLEELILMICAEELLELVKNGRPEEVR